MACEQARAELHRYLDGELESREIINLEAHLMDCKVCRAEYDQLCAVVHSLRGAGPLYEPSDLLESKVRDITGSHDRRLGRSRVVRTICAVAAIIAVAIGLSVWLRSRNTSMQFNEFAAESHARYVQGVLPLDVASEEPRHVNSWLAKRMAFHFQLPDYPGPKRYSLAGARLLQFQDSDATYVAYSMQGRPISLIAAPSTRVITAGGETYRSGGLVFHLSRHGGYRVMSWTDRDLSYALVSDVNADKAESCIVCHGSEDDRRKVEDLRRTQ